jgi:hypothetical protein
MGICCCKNCKKEYDDFYIPPESDDLYYNYASYANEMGKNVDEQKFRYYYKNGCWEAVEIIETGAEMNEIY